MVQLKKILILASVLATTAFSLERTRLNGPVFNKLSPIRSVASQPEFQQLPSATALTAVEKSKSRADVVASSGAQSAGESPSLLSMVWNEQTKLSFYLAVWYGGNIYYNIYNKKACNALGKNAQGGSNLHWALSAAQLLVGVMLVLPMWLTGVRKSPDLTLDNWKELSPVGLWAALSHAFSVLSMAVGAVSFGQIVKAGEPVFAAATNALILKVPVG
jgi:hypothetical protein